MRHARATAGAAAILLALGLGACNQTAATSPATPSGGTVAYPLTPSNFRLPEGGGCSGNIARFRAVLKNDHDTGNVGDGVYNRATGDLDRAAAACSAGRDGEANGIVASTKGRFGYPS